MEGFDLVVVNLYPFTDTVMSGAGQDECIEQIDIGGPTMVRAAAKNHASVAVVTSPAAYSNVLWAARGGGFTLGQRQRLAAEAFVHTATYDVNVASWMGNVVADTSDGTGFPAWVGATWEKAAVLRYGENPHQPAALYTSSFVPEPGLAQAEQLHGKEMSYNNYVDADAAVRAAHDHGDQPTVAIIKHANPCGIAVGDTIDVAYAKAHACDPVSAFGGIIATNRPVTAEMAEQVKDVFTEVVVAPAFDDAALEILKGKKNIRLLTCAPPPRGRRGDPADLRRAADAVARHRGRRGRGRRRRPVPVVAGCGEAADKGRWLTWRSPGRRFARSSPTPSCSPATGPPSASAWARSTGSTPATSPSRRAGEGRAHGAVAASDAFFPFADGLQVLLDAGVSAVVAPGGSMRDQEVIDAARAAGVTMYFTGPVTSPIRPSAH